MFCNHSSIEKFIKSYLRLLRMKFCFFGHVHGNLKTLEDLFNLISKERLDYVVCMGDLLHNGTNYNEVRCLEFARELYKRDEAPYWVWLNGNHDKKILDNIKAEINIRIFIKKRIPIWIFVS